MGGRISGQMGRRRIASPSLGFCRSFSRVIICHFFCILSTFHRIIHSFELHCTTFNATFNACWACPEFRYAESKHAQTVSRRGLPHPAKPCFEQPTKLRPTFCDGISTGMSLSLCPCYPILSENGYLSILVPISTVYWMDWMFGFWITNSANLLFSLQDGGLQIYL